MSEQLTSPLESSSEVNRLWSFQCYRTKTLKYTNHLADHSLLRLTDTLESKALKIILSPQVTLGGITEVTGLADTAMAYCFTSWESQYKSTPLAPATPTGALV